MDEGERVYGTIFALWNYDIGRGIVRGGQRVFRFLR